jgi:hypothetical protein
MAQDDQFFSFEIDHIIAEKHGGVTSEENLCLACTDCNSLKGSDIASVDWANGEVIVGLYHPRRHAWKEHFQIEMIRGHVEPMSSQGRVTVFLLQFNTLDRVTDRQLLIAEVRYPKATSLNRE